MAADERLDQLEPLLSEALTILDRHTHQLKQLNGAVGNLAIIVAKQGDNISFLLQEQLIIKTDMAGMNGELDLLIQLIHNSGK